MFESLRRRWAIGTALFAALAMRAALIPFRTSDQDYFLVPWLESARTSGIGYLRSAFTNYTAFYEHVLFLLAQMPGPPMLRIKLFSILFDLLLAGTVAALVPREWRWPAFALTLLLPTIMLNSAFLGQADAIYAVPIMVSLWCCARERPLLAMLAFGVALAIKLQAILFAPLLLILMLDRRLPWWTIVLAPLPYVAFALPMVLAGRPVADVFLVYAHQFHAFEQLSANAPNPWIWVQPFLPYTAGVAIGLPLAIAATGAMIVLLWRSGIVRTREGLLLAAAIVVIAVPFVTPKMHDRYFFLASPMLVALVFHQRRYVLALALVEAGSLLAYLPYMAEEYHFADRIFGEFGALERHFGIGYGIFPGIGAFLIGAALIDLVRRANGLSLQVRDGPVQIEPADPPPIAAVIKTSRSRNQPDPNRA